MGQCVSRKAAGAFAASAAATHKKHSTMQKHNNFEQSPDYDDNKDNTTKRTTSHSKGVAMSFGFRRRPVTAPSIADNATAARRLAKHEIIDRNGNGDMEPLTSNAIPPGRTTPRLAPPRKEANATRVSRFGFRKPDANRLHRVADINNAPPPTHLEYKNNNKPNYRPAATLQPRPKSSVVTVDSNDNKTTRLNYPPPTQINRFTLQSTQLPRPQLPVRVIETKTAKTLANNNKKASRGMHPSEDCSSKEGSVTEDSGVGSHSSAGTGETDTLQGVELLDTSPTLASRRNRQLKSRQYEMVVSGKNFDLRDLDDSSEPIVPLPRLPSAFQNFNNGFVRERRLEYEKQLEKSRRKISITSSEGFSDDYVDDERMGQNNRFTNEVASPPKTFLKSKKKKVDSSPPSSDEHEWMHAGEAMAEDLSCSFSSSDESKEKESVVNTKSAVKPASLALQNLMNASITSCTAPSREIKNVLLIMEDPKFAAVAAASNTSALLEDETSPVDSLICSYSETEDFIKNKILNNDIKKGAIMMSSSTSKDINEKSSISPSSPGTPTNASNSLSLSDGKDYFDDEIADQPALVFDDTITATTSEPISITQQNSENTPTLIDSTPKPKRKLLGTFEGSPLLLRKKTLLNSRTASVDTLSPCESITSDDLMLDYEQSQGSGLDDTVERNDRRNNGFHSLDDTTLKMEDSKAIDLWAIPVCSGSNKGSPKSMARSSRLLRSRASTPSSVPDSPCSLDSRINSKSHSVTRSPMRPPRPSIGSPVGYESDDSIKIDRASHGAMVQDIVQMKTMLVKLKRVLNESETLNPFDSQQGLKNGLFNGLSSGDASTENLDESGSTRLEMADLRRQVLFLQGQLEDREQAVQSLQERMDKLIMDTETAKSAPASTVSSEVSTVNAATQTERVRPVSAGPSLLQVSPTDGSMGSLVSVSENVRRSHPPCVVETSPLCNSNSRKSLPKLWRQPGEPPSPQRYGSNSSHSSIPRRANSRTRAPSTPS